MVIRITTPKPLPVPVLPDDIAPDVCFIQNRYPKVGNRIVLMWGSVELQKYLRTTIFDERGGRQGFPQPVISSLIRIYGFHESLLPQPGNRDVWSESV